MSCEQFSESIAALADGTLPASERPRVEIHLEACSACRGLLEDLRAIGRDARSMESAALPDGLWQRIAARLREQGVHEERPAGSGRMSRHWLGIAALLVAAVALALLAARMTRPAPPAQNAASTHTESPALEGSAAPPATVQNVQAELRMAEEHYERAITGLEQVAAREENSLDPQVAATVKRNLQVIDQAIAESRSALNVEPQSQPARESLFEALRRKIMLLQDTIALMNEMRKGNQAEAGDIVESLDKS